MTGPADALRAHAELNQASSPLYRELMLRLADDIEAGGPTAAVVAGEAEAGWRDAFALRLMAAVHRAVLERRAPELALFYPSVGGGGDPALAWPALRELMATQPDELRRDLARRCQTNDPGRAAALLTGLLHAVEATGVHDVRLLEIGASAGLNLRVDHFRIGDRGPVDSPCVVPDPWVGGEPPRVHWRLVARRGCDPAPIDPASADGRLALTSSVWADQLHRFERLRGALAVAAEVPATVDVGGGASWLPAQLAAARPGELVVVWHSVVAQYVDPGEWAEIEAIVAAAQADPAQRVAHIRLEPAAVPVRGGMPITVTLPGGEPVVEAVGGPHGTPVSYAGVA